MGQGPPAMLTEGLVVPLKKNFRESISSLEDLYPIKISQANFFMLQI